MKFIWIKGEKASAFQDALAVRDTVFTQEQGFPAEIDHDAMDQNSWHLLLYRDDKDDLDRLDRLDRSEHRVEKFEDLTIEHDLALEAAEIGLSSGKSKNSTTDRSHLEAIGTLRFFLNSDGVYQVGRVAILKAYRGYRLGQFLLKEALKKMAVLAESDEVILHAQLAAKGFYERYQFKAEGETFLEEGEPHITMRRRLALGKIPAERLAQAERILFIAHLAIGDFTYLQNGFRAFKEAYPHLKIDLFIEEVRCTNDPKKWPFLKKYSLYDWVGKCGIFDKIYNKNYSPALRLESIVEAKLQKYPIVVSIETLASLNGAGLARDIAGPDGFAMGMDIRYRWYQIREKLDLKKLNATIEVVKPHNGDDRHISDDYAYWFSQIGGVMLFPEERYPFVKIPKKWQKDARKQLKKWGATAEQPIVFINHIAKNPRRSWKLEQVRELIELMQKHPQWQNSFFIINGIPEIFPEIRALIEKHQLQNTAPFSALDNFFQLPAMLANSDLIISVETAVMHLANAVHVPVIALMRIKTLEWVPLNEALTTLIFTPKRADVIADIPPQRVIDALPEDPFAGRGERILDKHLDDLSDDVDDDFDIEETTAEGESSGASEEGE